MNNTSSEQKSSKRQFLPITKESVDSFVIEQENNGTARKTLSDMRTLTQYFETKQEQRNIYEIPKMSYLPCYHNLLYVSGRLMVRTMSLPPCAAWYAALTEFWDVITMASKYLRTANLVKLGMSYPQNKLSFKRMARATHQTNLNHCWIVI